MKALVIHGLRFDSRLTTFQHTLSFARHLNGFEVTYVNGHGLVDEDLLTQTFDLVIITYELIALRNTPFWPYIAQRISTLIRNSRVRVVMPQDDYSSSSKLDDFIVENNIQHVFSPLTHDLHMIYPRSLKAGVQFSEAFTGYWESGTAVPYHKYRKDFKNRSIDLGQRVRHLPPQLGPAAQRKGELAIRFSEEASVRGFSCDVSTKDSDVLLGDEWWKFLGDTKFTVGRLGGASVVDPHGKLAMKVNQLQLRNPKISYDEIAKKLHTEKLEQGNFTAISPRLFECAAMGVCQILERDEYFDDFLPWIHYLPLKPDLSNLEEIFSAMRDTERCSEISYEAEKNLITSGKYSYSEFIKRLVRTTLAVELDPVLPTRLIDYDEKLFGTLGFDEVEATKKMVRKSVVWNNRRMINESQGLIKLWIDNFSKKNLIVESLTIPWSSALVHLAKS
jgi:hypothetical protein